MTTIPDDIRKRATQIFADVDYTDTVPEAIDIIAEALMQERERCAKVADVAVACAIAYAKASKDISDGCLYRGEEGAARYIANRIRDPNYDPFAKSPRSPDQTP